MVLSEPSAFFNLYLEAKCKVAKHNITNSSGLSECAGRAEGVQNGSTSSEFTRFEGPPF